MGALDTRSAFQFAAPSVPCGHTALSLGESCCPRKCLSRHKRAACNASLCKRRSPLCASMHAMWAQRSACSRASDDIITHRVAAQLEEEIQEDLKWSILVKKKLYSGKSDFQTVELIESGPFAKARLLRMRCGRADCRANTLRLLQEAAGKPDASVRLPTWLSAFQGSCHCLRFDLAPATEQWLPGSKDTLVSCVLFSRRCILSIQRTCETRRRSSVSARLGAECNLHDSAGCKFLCKWLWPTSPRLPPARAPAAL